jgi:hypothetical protein
MSETHIDTRTGAEIDPWKRIAKLERECEALRRDKERLDFLEKHADAVSNLGSGAADDKWWEVLHHDGNKAEGGSLREAIDKAIGETKG